MHTLLVYKFFFSFNLLMFLSWLSSSFFTLLIFLSDKGLCALNECVRKPDAVALSEMNTWIPMAIRCSLKDIIPSDLVSCFEIILLIFVAYDVCSPS